MNQTLTLIGDVMQVVRDSGLLSSTCTITRSTEDFDAGGAPVATTAYEPVDGLTDIACMDAPLNTGGNMGMFERVKVEEIEAQFDRHILLDGFYPGILTTDRATVTDSHDIETEYEIIKVECDSQRQMTRIAALKVTI